MKRNPKQRYSNLWDCIPQRGPCPTNCPECYYNRPGAFYAGFEPVLPNPCHLGEDAVVRINSGNDSANQKDLVMKMASRYPNHFFNTSQPDFDWPAPFVLTANRLENDRPQAILPPLSLYGIPANLMFVRVRVGHSNVGLARDLVRAWNHWGVPVVLTFSAYYTKEPPTPIFAGTPLCRGTSLGSKLPYIWKTRHINPYWCPSEDYIRLVLLALHREANYSRNLLTMCGTPTSNLCVDCRNCEFFYWQTIKLMKEVTIDAMPMEEEKQEEKEKMRGEKDGGWNATDTILNT